MFGGNTKSDLDNVIINLSDAYDFIDAYAESQKSNKDSVGYQAAILLTEHIRGCFKELKSINRYLIVPKNKYDIVNYTKKYTWNDERKPNKYMAVFANPNVSNDREIMSMLMKIKLASDSAVHDQSDEKQAQAMKLIDQYRKKVNEKA